MQEENPPLPANYFRRYDETPDETFYALPRFVTHIDDAAIGAVTQIYREYLPADGRILDLMSSWVSHLPSDVAYRHVTGLGMNRAELDANPRLHERIVQNLNRTPDLPFDDEVFDGAGICVSVQYLTQPVAVLREVGRVLRPGAPLIITFSNRCFPTKAVAIWQAIDDDEHATLIRQYFDAAGNWQRVELQDRSPQPGRGDPLYAAIGWRRGRHQTLDSAK